jgi:tRNA 2-thiocytidine biosynthesis protein TtcA
MISTESLMKGSIPPWIRRFVKQTGRGINRHAMIRENDRVLLSISGGKDSLALAMALSLRKIWLPVDYELEALHIEWKEHPLGKEKIEALQEYFRLLKIPFTSLEAGMFPDSFGGKFNCYLCSRNRRRILFQYARDRDIRIIAMGHHLDDIVETTLINLCFRGEFSSMQPVQDFFSGKLRVIRPLCEVRETAIDRLARETDMPVAKAPCPYDQTNIRSRVKPIVHALSHIDTLTREHVYKALGYTEEVEKKGRNVLQD